MTKREVPTYATWIRGQRIVLFWLLALGMAALGFGALVWPPLGFLGFLGLPFLYIATVLSWTAHRFSPRGGDFQNRVHRALIDALDARGGVLDVGCGSGHLLIKIALQNPAAHRGLDFWGKDWEYSREQCQKNARLEGVNNVEFYQGSASRLPFESASIDNVVSCLTFHEVHDVVDKTQSLTEALRVLKPGGRFAFFDLFRDPQFYPNPDAVRTAIEAGQGQIEQVLDYGREGQLPFPLTMKKVLGYATLISGTKAR